MGRERFAVELEAVAKRFNRAMPARASLIRMIRDWENNIHRPRDYYVLFILLYASQPELAARTIEPDSELDRLMTALELMGVPMDRRKFLLNSAALAAGITLEPVQQWPSLLDLFDDDPLAHAAGRLEYLFKLQWSGEPGAKVYKLLVRHANDLKDFTDRLPESEVRRDLRAVQARTHWMAGNVAGVHLGRHAAAESHFRVGLQAATKSSDPRLRAQLCAKLAHSRLYDRRSRADTETLLHEGLWILESGSKYADGNPFVLANLLIYRAEIHAALGSGTGCMESLDRAAQALESASPGDAPPWLAGFDPTSRIESYAGACWLRLGDAKRATEKLHKALNGVGSERSDDNTVLLADAARASVLCKEPEHGVSLLHRAIPIAARNKSVICADRIRDARAALAPWDEQPFVRELDEQMGALPAQGSA